MFTSVNNEDSVPSNVKLSLPAGLQGQPFQAACNVLLRSPSVATVAAGTESILFDGVRIMVGVSVQKPSFQGWARENEKHYKLTKLPRGQAESKKTRGHILRRCSYFSCFLLL